MNRKSTLLYVFQIFFFSVIINFAHAACETDRSGIVHCSRYPGGGAALSVDGNVVCGKGECQRNKFGRFECSIVEGGGAGRDHRGTVRCLGGCEEASEDRCELGK
jgi:hypothetical protein